jgi:hypothetical protein
MSKTLRVLFLLLSSIAIPIVSVLMISTSFELVRSFYRSFYDSYLSTAYVASVSLILTFGCMASVLASDEEEVEESSSLSWE